MLEPPDQRRRSMTDIPQHLHGSAPFTAEHEHVARVGSLVSVTGEPAIGPRAISHHRLVCAAFSHGDKSAARLAPRLQPQAPSAAHSQQLAHHELLPAAVHLRVAATAWQSCARSPISHSGRWPLPRRPATCPQPSTASPPTPDLRQISALPVAHNPHHSVAAGPLGRLASSISHFRHSRLNSPSNEGDTGSTLTQQAHHLVLHMPVPGLNDTSSNHPFDQRCQPCMRLMTRPSLALRIGPLVPASPAFVPSRQNGRI